MSWIKVIPPEDAGPELGDQYDRIVRSSGSVANILRVQSLNPASLRTHYDLYRTLMFRPSSMSRAQREMVAVVVSVANHCHY